MNAIQKLAKHAETRSTEQLKKDLIVAANSLEFGACIAYNAIFDVLEARIGWDAVEELVEANV